MDDGMVIIRRDQSHCQVLFSAAQGPSGQSELRRVRAETRNIQIVGPQARNLWRRRDSQHGLQNRLRSGLQRGGRFRP